MPMQFTKLVEGQRAFYRSGGLATLGARRKELEKFKSLMQQHKAAIDEAIFKDIRRDASLFCEVEGAIAMANEVLKNLDEWTAPKPLSIDAGSLIPGGLSGDDTLSLVPEPYGVVLIIGPWNGPLACVSHLVHAIGAGNSVIVKPSELAANFSSIFAKVVNEAFDQRILAVVEGGVHETTQLLEERFDYILYTGCPPVAKIIMAAAAKNLTPVTLELGGKNPVFIDSSADLSLFVGAVQKAKILNAGQICISTDYVLTTPEMKPKVIAALKEGFDAVGDMSKLPNFARIINDRHFQRLMAILEKTKGKIVYKAGGEISRNDKFIPFHAVEIDFDDAFMEEEIFGPLLPIITIKDFDTALEYIKKNDKPLAAYIFTKNDEQARRFVRETSSGGVSVNDAMAHMAPGAPFGGVGNSGMGRLYGKYSFDTFTHEKAVAVRGGVKANLGF